MGTRADFDLAYERFFAPIRLKSGRILANPQAADDVTQEVFLRLWQWGSRPALDSVEGTRTVLAWLYRTCTHLAIDVLRARKWTPVDTSEAHRLPCASDIAGSVAARAAIVALVATVEDDELQAAILCHVDGLSQPEAAMVLETSERTVRRLLARFDERIDPIRREFAR